MVLLSFHIFKKTLEGRHHKHSNLFTFLLFKSLVIFTENFWKIHYNFTMHLLSRNEQTKTITNCFCINNLCICFINIKCVNSIKNFSQKINYLNGNFHAFMFLKIHLKNLCKNSLTF